MALPDDRYFSPNRQQKEIAQRLYSTVANLPLICPHGHVDPRMFVDPDYSFGTPTDLLLIPDHYIFRMIHSQGIPLEALGVPRVDGGDTEMDPRAIWQIFAENFYLFRGTPSGIWLSYVLTNLFGITEKLNASNATAVYDHIARLLDTPGFRPRTLFEHFDIEVLCTTDAATDSLDYHRAIRESGWKGHILPTFRPDNVINIDAPDWRANIDALEELSGVTVENYHGLIHALEERRHFFKTMGAKATDHAANSAFTQELSDMDAEDIFQRALRGQTSAEDATLFTGHMLIQMARMSVEDGLVMQLHVGSFRNHDRRVYERFGTNRGADIPVRTEFTRSLRPLLDKFGDDRRLTLILFTLDESTYSRELAPLAGYYPALKLGPPWWFYDSLNGIRRYFDEVIETAGLYNTVGFNDDTRAFPSIPARHDLWRRACADWLAGLVIRNIVDTEDAQAMMYDCAYRLAKKTYNLD